MSNRIGRPKTQRSKTSTRQRILDTALEYFIEKGFERTSTREIARCTGVDAAMIRYYFGSKAGLFETVITENLEPVMSLLRHSNQAQPIELKHFIETYYQALGSKHGLPQLIFQTLHQETSQTAHNAIRSVFSELAVQLRKWLKAHASKAQLRPDICPDLMYITTISCIVFPLIAPPFIKQQLGVDLSKAGIEMLAQHNSSFIFNGLFQTATTDHPKATLHE